MKLRLHDSPPAHLILTAWVLFALLSHYSLLPRVAAESNKVSGLGLRLVTEGLGAPLSLVPIPDGSGRLLLAEQSGIIHLLSRDGNRAEQLFLDLRPKMVAINQLGVRHPRQTL